MSGIRLADVKCIVVSVTCLRYNIVVGAQDRRERTLEDWLSAWEAGLFLEFRRRAKDKNCDLMMLASIEIQAQLATKEAADAARIKGFQLKGHS